MTEYQHNTEFDEEVAAYSPYMEALEKQRVAVANWCDLLNDGFKAPEQKVGLPPEVFSATIEVIAAYQNIKAGK